jgi:hypothetical protein
MYCLIETVRAHGLHPLAIVPEPADKMYSSVLLYAMATARCGA